MENDAGETAEDRILAKLTAIEQRLSMLEEKAVEAETETEGEVEEDGSVAENVAALRSDTKLQRQVTQRLRSLGIGYSSEDDDDEDSDKKGTSTKGKQRAKSGRIKTASDFIKIEVEWSHYHVYRGSTRKPAAYDDLTAVEFVYGYLATVLEGNHSAATKDQMLHHLKGLMMDAAEFSFDGARNCHGIVLQHIEQGRLTWADRDKLSELRRNYAQRRPEEDFAGGNKSRGRTPLFCLKYQEEKCSYTGDHQTTRGFVKHACAYCLRLTGNSYRHSEQQCRRKQGGGHNVSSAAKNEEL